MANYVPARLTALLMIIVALKPRLLRFVLRFGPQHASPNSGWPEAALAGILGCQFGGPHVYFGELIDKPFIGTTDRALTLPHQLPLRAPHAPPLCGCALRVSGERNAFSLTCSVAWYDYLKTTKRSSLLTS